MKVHPLVFSPSQGSWEWSSQLQDTSRDWQHLCCNWIAVQLSAQLFLYFCDVDDWTWGPHIHDRQPFYDWALGLNCNNCWVPNLRNSKIKRKRRHQAQAKTLKIWRPKQHKFCRIEAKRYRYLSSLVFISLIFWFLLMDFLPRAYFDGISILFFSFYRDFNFQQVLKALHRFFFK